MFGRHQSQAKYNMEKYIELAKKLKALAEKGVDGEKENAQNKLELIMKKYGISTEDIEDEHKFMVWYKVKSTERKLFEQVATSVFGSEFDMYTNRNKTGYLGIEGSGSDHIQFEFKYEMYVKAYRKQLDVFFTAFVMRNNIYAKNGEKKDWSELSDEEKRKYAEAEQMASGMKEVDIIKRLTAKN